MKQIVKGEMYDTDKATHIARGDHGSDLSDASWHLYQTPGGVFFEAVYDHDGRPKASKFLRKRKRGSFSK